MKFDRKMVSILFLVAALSFGVGTWLYLDVSEKDSSGNTNYALSKAWASTMDEVVTNLLEESAGMSAHFIQNEEVNLTTIAEKLSGISEVNDTYVMGGCPSYSEYICLVDISGNNVVFKSQIVPVSAWDLDDVTTVARQVNLSVWGKGNYYNKVTPVGITYFDWRYPEADRLVMAKDGNIQSNGSVNCYASQSATDLMQIRIPSGISALQATVDIKKSCQVSGFEGGKLEITPDIEISVPSDAVYNQNITESINTSVFDNSQIVDLSLTGEYIFYQLAILAKGN